LVHPVILFDGICNLCNWFVQVVIRRDPGARFRFASLQSGVASRLLDARPIGDVPGGTFVLVEGDRIFVRSTAAIRVMSQLGFPWSLASLLLALPEPLRDSAYRVVAANRYRWFGTRDRCMIPTPEIRSRFLDV
jgi:predicted DCC family thiol-disulfide oxidoreductase YuxK